MQTDDRDFINIDLFSGEELPEEGRTREKRESFGKSETHEGRETREKGEKFQRDLERLEKIQKETRLRRIREETRRQRAAEESVSQIRKTDSRRDAESVSASTGAVGTSSGPSGAERSRHSQRKSAGSEKNERSAERRGERTERRKGDRIGAPRKEGGEDQGKRKRPRKAGRPGVLAFLMFFLILWGIKNLFFGGYTHQGGYYTVAVFGVDSRDGNLGKGALADVNMLVALNKATGEIKLCSIYRDTFVQINSDGKRHKFNEAYFKGGPEQALWTMKYNLDINPDDYITFNWKAVIDSINIMGGIDLEITDPEFAYINSFITETVQATGIGSVHLKHAGQNHLDGVQAVAYARLRLMDSDFNRTERQRKVVSLLLDKIRAAGLEKRLELVRSVVPETKTSISVDDLLIYAKGIKKYHLAATAGFPFEKDTAWVERKDCVVPVTMESNVVELHQFLYGDTDYRASSSVKSISTYIIEKTGKNLPKKKKE